MLRFGAILLVCLVGRISGKEECSIACPFNLDPVCGSDGKSYSNFCIFVSAQCELEHQGKSLYLAGLPTMRKVNGVGECLTAFADMNPDNCDVQCPRAGAMGESSVCGSDSVVYSDRCNFEVARCKAKLENVELKRLPC